MNAFRVHTGVKPQVRGGVHAFTPIGGERTVNALFPTGGAVAIPSISGIVERYIADAPSAFGATLHGDPNRHGRGGSSLAAGPANSADTGQTGA